MDGSMVTSAVVASGEFELGDVVNAARVGMLRRKAVWYSMSAFGALLFAFPVFVVATGRGSLDWAPLVVGAFWATVLWWFPELNGRSHWRKNAFLRGRQDFYLTDDGLSRMSSAGRFELRWHAFLGWSENDRQFCLYPTANSVTFVPKRFFNSVTATQSFREALSSRIPSK